jgi:hypothetical protein
MKKVLLIIAFLSQLLLVTKPQEVKEVKTVYVDTSVLIERIYRSERS